MPVMPGYANADTPHERTVHLASQGWRYGWLPIPEKHPTFDPVDLQLADGSVLCGCVPQLDGDYWWKGPSGEVFIDPKYASVTHWRLAATPKPEGK